MSTDDSNEKNGYQGVERRVQSESGLPKNAAQRRRTSDRAGRRHSAIKAKIPSWHSYRSWAYKVRGSWEESN